MSDTSEKRGRAARQAERWRRAWDRDESARMARAAPPPVSLADDFADYLDDWFGGLEARMESFRVGWVAAFRDALSQADPPETGV